MAASAAEYFEVRWRVKDSGEAWAGPRQIAPTSEIVITELDRTQQYEMEVRAVSNCGAKSVWVPSDYTVPGAVPPVPVDTLTAQPLADGVHLGWTSIAIPAAGVEYSVERSADGSTGWAERIRLRATAYTDPETTGATFYYRVRGVNFAGQYGAYSPIVSSAGVSVGDIGANAANAAADAAAALLEADAANAALANIASDSVLSPNEKPVVIRDNNVILTEQAGIDAQASAYGITTEKTAYDGKVSALTSYLATLTSPVLWSDLSGNTTIVGATFRQKFADVYTSRQSLLNAIYAAAKSKADTAKAAADAAAATANNAAPAYVINPGFDLLPIGLGWAADFGTWYVNSGGVSPGVNPSCAERVGSAGTPTDVYRNAGKCFVIAGQQYKAQALIQALGANGTCRVRISWRDANDAEGSLVPSYGNVVTGTTTNGSYAVAPAPSGAVYAHVEIVASAHTAGAYRVDNVVSTIQPANVGEVPDGGGRYAVNQVDGNGLAVVDFSQGAHVNKTQDYIGDGGTYARIKASSLTGNDFDFSKGGVKKNLDYIADTSTFARVRGGALYSGVPTGISFGNNLVANPSWSSNVAGFSSPVITTSTGIADGWKSSLNPTYHAIFRENTSGSYSVAIKLLMGVTLPAASGYIEADAVMVGMFDVLASRQYRFRTTGSVGIAETPPAGVLTIYRSDVFWYRGDGTLISNSPQDANNPTAGTYNFDVTLTPPAGAVKGAVVLSSFVNNTNGSPVTTSTTNAWFDARWFSVGVYLVAAMDSEIADGTLYGRTSQTDLVSNRVGLRIAGSGHRIGDQRNLTAVTFGNYGSGWSGLSLSYTSTTTSATISATAATLQAGGSSAAYSASSVTVSGSAGSTATYYLYYVDPGMVGGARTLQATTNQITSLSNDGNVLLGICTVTFPTSGTGGGSGGTSCPSVDAWVIRRGLNGEHETVRAGSIVVGDDLALARGGWGRVTYSVPKLMPCVRVIVNNHDPFSLSCSRTAPLGLCSGGSVLAPDSLGEWVRVLHPVPALCAMVTAVEDIGTRWVQHITCEDDFFWAGDHPGCLFSHHNLKPLIP